MPKLTPDDIRDLLTEYETQVYAQMHREMRDDMRVINASSGYARGLIPAYVKGMPKTNFIPKVKPYAKKGVSIAVDHTLVGEKPAARYVLRGKSSDAMEVRRKLTEDTGNAILQNIADRTTVNPFKDMLAKQHGPGGGALTFPFRWDVWEAYRAEEDEEERERMKRDLWCWDVFVTAPTVCFPDPDHDPPEHFIVKDKISNRVARQLYPKTQVAADKKGKVERVIYCAKDQYTVLIGTEVVEDGDNPCGMVWYEWVWGGYGEPDEERRFEFLGQGLIRHAKDTIAEVVLADNTNEIMRVTSALVPYVIKSQDEADADKVADEIEFGPNALLRLKNTDSIAPLEGREIPASVAYSKESGMAALELIFGQTILTGFYPEKTASGQRQRVNLAETPFLPAKIAGEQAVGNMLTKQIRFLKYELTRNDGERYTLPSSKYGPLLDVDPEQLLDIGYWEIDFTPPTAEDRAFNKENDARDLERGVIDMDEYRRRQQIEDGEQMDDRARKRRLIDSLEPVAQQILQQRFSAMNGVGAQPGLEMGAPTATAAQTPMSGNADELTPPEATQAEAAKMFSLPQNTMAGVA